jgi:hypothetical protein
MRKRSEVSRQTSLDTNPAAPSPTSPTAGIAFYVCSCGLKQAKGVLASNDGNCLRCGNPVDMSGNPVEVAQAGNGVAKPSENGDPWKLRPESAPAQPAQPAQSAKAPDSKQSASSGQPFGADAVPITQLCKLLASAGYVVPLTEAATLTPLQRTVAYAWMTGVDADGEAPHFLEKYAAEHAPTSEGAASGPEASDARAPVGPPYPQGQSTDAAPSGARTRSRSRKEPPPPVTPRGGGQELQEIGRRIAAEHAPGGEETVSYTWGEEKYTPVPNSFSTVTVGPITMTTTVREGEAHYEALDRLQRAVRARVDTERTEKIASFLHKYREVRAEVKKVDAQAVS